MSHDPQKRAAARFGPEQLRAIENAVFSTVCEHGEDVYLPHLRRNGWKPVVGPHKIALRSKDRRNKTGCVGISETVIQARKNGRVSCKRYFYVQLGRQSRRFNIDALGRAEAWRRALRLRARHEILIQNLNERIDFARQQEIAR